MGSGLHIDDKPRYGGGKLTKAQVNKALRSSGAGKSHNPVSDTVNRLASLSELENISIYQRSGSGLEDPYLRTVPAKKPLASGAKLAINSKLSNFDLLNTTAAASMNRELSGRVSHMVTHNKTNTSSFGSFMSQNFAPRSSSVMGKPSPQKVLPQPIEGSFIVIDSNSRNLKDMGTFRPRGKHETYGRGAIKNIVQRQARFNSNF